MRIDAIRRERRPELDPEDLAPEAELLADDGLALADDEARLRAALKGLPPDQIQVIELSFFQDKPHGDIARVISATGRISPEEVVTVGTQVSGKVERLRRWLQERGEPYTVLREASFYTDSINDLPLLSVVRWPVVVDPDPRRESAALRKGWQVLHFRR